MQPVFLEPDFPPLQGVSVRDMIGESSEGAQEANRLYNPSPMYTIATKQTHGDVQLLVAFVKSCAIFSVLHYIQITNDRLALFDPWCYKGFSGAFFLFFGGRRGRNEHHPALHLYFGPKYVLST